MKSLRLSLIFSVITAFATGWLVASNAKSRTDVQDCGESCCKERNTSPTVDCCE